MIEKIEKPNWSKLINTTFDSEDRLNYWFADVISPINRALENAVEVYSHTKGMEWYTRDTRSFEDVTHKALLVNIEPVEKDSYEKICEAFIEDRNQRHERLPVIHGLDELERRIRRLKRDGPKS